MARALTENERCVLSHVVVDPDEWWEHATNWPKIDEEAALAAKVARWKPSYDGECHQPDYKTRAVREAEEDQRLAETAESAGDAVVAAKVAADAELQAKIDAAVAAALSK